jgi:hypothetical protein
MHNTVHELYIVICTVIIFYTWCAFLCFFLLITYSKAFCHSENMWMHGTNLWMMYMCIYTHTHIYIHKFIIYIYMRRQFHSTSALPMDNCLTPSYLSSRSRGRPHGFTRYCGKDSNFFLINNLSLNSWSSRPYNFHCTEQFLLTVSRDFRNNLMVSVLLPLVEVGTSQMRNLTTTSINFPFWLFL